jgi:hypothetical protein
MQIDLYAEAVDLTHKLQATVPFHAYPTKQASMTLLPLPSRSDNRGLCCEMMSGCSTHGKRESPATTT